MVERTVPDFVGVLVPMGDISRIARVLYRIKSGIESIVLTTSTNLT